MATPPRKEKRALYLIRYNAPTQTVSEQTGIDKEQAQEMIDEFNKQYPQVRKFLNEQKDKI